jgi:hypothetical protein
MTACNMRPPEGHPFHGSLVACHLRAGHKDDGIPHSWEIPAGAETYRLQFSREDDDHLDVPDLGRRNVVRISIGGHDDVGYYFKFRGDPAEVVKVMEMMHAAAKQQLPRGRYHDARTRRAD